MTTPECRKCHRHIGDPERFHGFGPKCWRAVKAEALAVAVRVHVANVSRRWNSDMPGQQELQLEET